MKEIIVNVDNYNENSIKTIEGDNLSEVYKIYICKNKRRIDLTNKIAIMAYVNEYGNKKSNILALNITNASQGEIELPITNVISSENGVYACQVAIYGENNSLEQTAPFSLIVENNIFSKISNTAINSSDFHILSEAIKTTTAYAEKLQQGTENIELQYANKLHEINSQLYNTYNKQEVDEKVFHMVNMGQDIKEAMTGGSVAVVGEDAVNTINLRNKSVTEEKLNNELSEKINNSKEELYKIKSNLKLGENLFNKYSNNNIDGAMLDQNGALYDKAKNMFVSDYIGINSSSTISFFNFKTLINSNLNVVEYDINKNKVNVNQNVQGTITVNVLTKYIRFSYLLENKKSVFLGYGDSIDEFEDYFIKIDSLKISKSNLGENLIDDNMVEDNTIKPCKTSFAEIGKNLLNKNKLIDGVQLDTKGNLVDYMATERTSLDFLEIKPDTTYTLTAKNIKIAFFDEFKKFIKDVTTNTFTTTPNTFYIRITMHINSKDTAQLEVGESASEYEDYCVKIPLFKDDKINKNLKKLNNDVLELKNNSNIIQEKKINVTLCNLYPVDASITVSENSQKTSTSSIENFIKIDSITDDMINPVFRYTNAQMGKAGDTFPRFKYVDSHSVTRDSGRIGGGFFGVEFNIDCKEFEIITLGTMGSYRLAVDEGLGLKYTNEDKQKISEADGAGYLTKIVFKDKRIRKIRLELTNTIFGGLNIKRTDTVFPIGLPELPLACFTGSSITEGGYPWLVSQILGLNGINVGVGSTGYLEPGLNNRLKYIDRADHDIIKPNPAVVFIEGGINDSGHDIPDVVREADRLYKHIKSNLPNAKIIVIGMYWPRTPSESVLNMNKALRECALENEIPFIDLLKGDTVLSDGTLVTEGTGSFISGTGKDGSPRDDGNADIYTSSDSTHPTKQGKIYLATRLATEIYKILK